MTSYTPGPWEVDEDGCHIIDKDDHDLALVHDWEFDATFHKPHTLPLKQNARLMAAAPEMLDLLQVALKDLENLFVYAEEHYNIIGPDEKVMGDIKSLIEKLTSDQ